MFTECDIDILTTTSEDRSGYVVVKDGYFDDIIDQIFDEVQLLRSRCRRSQMSRGEQAWEDEHFRGDSICWISPELVQELSLSGLAEYTRRVIKECDVLKSHFGLTSEYSIQLAIYPGKGEGYNRHRDAFPDVPDQVSPLIKESTRQLTCLLYLNRDWTSPDGGQLRVFTLPGVTIDGLGEPFSFWGVNGYDIDPLFGRFVVFRSALVDHAVLPCFRERTAMTFWANGSGPAEQRSGASRKNESVFKFTPDNVEATSG